MTRTREVKEKEDERRWERVGWKDAKEKIKEREEEKSTVSTREEKRKREDENNRKKRDKETEK